MNRERNIRDILLRKSAFGFAVDDEHHRPLSDGIIGGEYARGQYLGLPLLWDAVVIRPRSMVMEWSISVIQQISIRLLYELTPLIRFVFACLAAS
ncbi:MAG: hypothetical protein VBE63_00970 [Lamprobacter sp.]|uniref:hypothetical protein n=1 Tax=Lamprobacter sp. TaxID=3100796 RepID=UPI002B2570B7|nr:hypothetical protein [Lamprobacter sp.]MEA3638497.1 hypothetical protein [Lamprobacter sp.]